ncbi:Sigma factor PP2C-like phosphatase [Aureococcus anophagefferens]|nr:Sigma factor PP2C-like phosphatase [Aureococcus anophagefferens]
MRPAGALDEGRLAFEFKQLRMIPAQLGGVGLDVEPCCQFVLEIKPAPDLDLEAPVTFDVHLDVAGFPGQPPRCHCNAPLDHLPPRVQRSQVVDPMGSVRLPLLDARSGWSRASGDGGRRRDAGRIRVPERDTANAALLIVFDGHGGKRCAEWASELLPERLRKRADRERDASGSTVLACLFDGTDRLYVASLGDCRCVLATRDGYCNLTTDCRADRPDEVARVVAARGFVANRRVNGQIAVSRALGDFAFKSPPDAPPAVSCEPDITEVQLRDGDDFLLIGCDGLYDVLTSEEAVDFARDQLRAGRPLDAAALNLVHHAIDDRDSRDNVSVILAKLSPAADLRGGAAAAPRAFDANDADALLADLDLAASSHGDDVDDRGEGRANSKSKIMDDDDLMDFLLDDANFD